MEFKTFKVTIDVYTDSVPESELKTELSYVLRRIAARIDEGNIPTMVTGSKGSNIAEINRLTCPVEETLDSELEGD